MSPKNTLLVLLFCLVQGCDQPIDEGSGQSGVTVIDFAGQMVSLPQPAMRVIALAPHLVENVFSAGAGQTLVGRVEYSDYPPQAASIEIVGGYEKISYEKILALDPDLILAWESGNSHSSINRLRELGFTIYINQPNTLHDVAKSLRDIGRLTGNEQHANTVANEYLSELARYQDDYRDARRITAFYQVWNKPLQTINGNHIISDAIETCGGNNIYADEFAVAPVVNIESVLERNPEAIIASGMSSARPQWLDEWLAWQSLAAVQNGNLFFVDPDHIQRHTVRLLLGIKAICTQLDLARRRHSQ